MRSSHICFLVSFIIGIILIIPGAVLLHQSYSCDDDDDCDNAAAMPLVIIGAILAFVPVAWFFGRTDNKGSSGKRVDGPTAERVIQNGNAGEANGRWMAQDINAQNQWQAQQQAQMQYTINNPV